MPMYCITYIHAYMLAYMLACLHTTWTFSVPSLLRSLSLLSQITDPASMPCRFCSRPTEPGRHRPWRRLNGGYCEPSLPPGYGAPFCTIIGAALAMTYWPALLNVTNVTTMWSGSRPPGSLHSLHSLRSLRNQGFANQTVGPATREQACWGQVCMANFVLQPAPGAPGAPAAALDNSICPMHLPAPFCSLCL